MTDLSVNSSMMVISRHMMEMHRPILETICRGWLGAWRRGSRKGRGREKTNHRHRALVIVSVYRWSSGAQEEGKAGEVEALTHSAVGRTGSLHYATSVRLKYLIAAKKQQTMTTTNNDNINSEPKQSQIQGLKLIAPGPVSFSFCIHSPI